MCYALPISLLSLFRPPPTSHTGDMTQQGSFSQTQGRNTEKRQVCSHAASHLNQPILQEVTISIPILPTIQSINTVFLAKHYLHPSQTGTSAFSLGIGMIGMLLLFWFPSRKREPRPLAFSTWHTADEFASVSIPQTGTSAFSREAHDYVRVHTGGFPSRKREPRPLASLWF